MINEVDADGSGQLDFQEFLSMMTSKMKDTDVEEEMVHAFDVFAQGGKSIDLAVLGEAMANIGEKFSSVELQEIIDEADAGGNGRVEFPEFRKVMTA